VGPERRRPGDVTVPAGRHRCARRSDLRAIEESEGRARTDHPRGDNSSPFGGRASRPGARQDRHLDFDAHHEVGSRTRATSGTPYYQISTPGRPRRGKERGPDGAATLCHSKTYRDWATKKGIRQFTMKESDATVQRGLESALEAATTASRPST